MEADPKSVVGISLYQEIGTTFAAAEFQGDTRTGPGCTLAEQGGYACGGHFRLISASRVVVMVQQERGARTRQEGCRQKRRQPC